MFEKCVTMCHMKTISIRELHARTGLWVRETARYGEIRVTDRGHFVAALRLPEQVPAYGGWRGRTLKPAFLRMRRTGQLRLTTDSTRLISDDRDER